MEKEVATMVKGINHVGIVVKNLNEAFSTLGEAFGCEEVYRMEVPQMQQISCIVRVGDNCFELIEPTSEEGPAGQFLKTRGGGIHHISLLCTDLNAVCTRLESMGLRIVSKILDGPFPIAFLHPKSANGVLYELTDRSSLERP
ncbi:MAG: VOC family protein [Acidobacteriota bacterium]